MAVNPTLDQIIQAGVDAGLAEISISFIGKVQAFHAADNTVDVQPMVRSPIERVDGSTLNEDLPVIPACPVHWMQTNRFALTFPIQPGDFGVLLVQTFSESTFLDTGAVSNPGDVRRNHIANCRFFPGYGPKSSKPQYAGDPDVVLEPGSAGIRLCGGASDFVTLAQKVAARLNNIESVMNAFVYNPGPGPAAHPLTVSVTAPSDVSSTKVKAL